MRRPLLFEVMAFARYLTTVPRPLRGKAASRILHDADRAERTFGSGQAQTATLGDGSLISRLLHETLPSEPYGDDTEFLHALRIAAHRLLKHSASRATCSPQQGRS